MAAAAPSSSAPVVGGAGVGVRMVHGSVSMGAGLTGRRAHLRGGLEIMAQGCASSSPTSGVSPAASSPSPSSLHALPTYSGAFGSMLPVHAATVGGGASRRQHSITSSALAAAMAAAAAQAAPPVSEARQRRNFELTHSGISGSGSSSHSAAHAAAAASSCAASPVDSSPRSRPSSSPSRHHRSATGSSGSSGIGHGRERSQQLQQQSQQQSAPVYYAATNTFGGEDINHCSNSAFNTQMRRVKERLREEKRSEAAAAAAAAQAQAAAAAAQQHDPHEFYTSQLLQRDRDAFLAPFHRGAPSPQYSSIFTSITSSGAGGHGGPSGLSSTLPPFPGSSGGGGPSRMHAPRQLSQSVQLYPHAPGAQARPNGSPAGSSSTAAAAVPGGHARNSRRRRGGWRGARDSPLRSSERDSDDEENALYSASSSDGEPQPPMPLRRPSALVARSRSAQTAMRQARLQHLQQQQHANNAQQQREPTPPPVAAAAAAAVAPSGPQRALSHSRSAFGAPIAAPASTPATQTQTQRASIGGGGGGGGTSILPLSRQRSSPTSPPTPSLPDPAAPPPSLACHSAAAAAAPLWPTVPRSGTSFPMGPCPDWSGCVPSYLEPLQPALGDRERAALLRRLRAGDEQKAARQAVLGCTVVYDSIDPNPEWSEGIPPARLSPAALAAWMPPACGPDPSASAGPSPVPGALPPYYIPSSGADATLVFESRFEGGNLRRAIQVGTWEYDLLVRPDVNTSNYAQWFCFSVRNTRAVTVVQQTPTQQQAQFPPSAAVAGAGVGAYSPFGPLSICGSGSSYSGSAGFAAAGSGLGGAFGTGASAVQAPQYQNVVYKFNIVNLQKSDSLFNQGVQPLFYSETKARESRRSGRHAPYQHHPPYTCPSDGGGPAVAFLPPTSPGAVGWFRGGYDVAYYRNGNGGASGGAGAGRRSSYTLSFCIELEYSMDTVHVASCYPYTLTTLYRSLSDLHTPAYAACMRQRTLCTSLAGNPVPLLIITNFLSEPQELARRPGVLLTARVHPGESNASFMALGAVRFLLGMGPASSSSSSSASASASAAAAATASSLRSRFVFYVVPMLNPDGVVLGNYRCSLAGVDLNRVWSNPDPAAHPTVFATKRLLAHLLGRDGTAAGGVAAGRGAPTAQAQAQAEQKGCDLGGSGSGGAGGRESPPAPSPSPSSAAAAAGMARPQFLEPMCGSAASPQEEAAMSPGRQVLMFADLHGHSRAQNIFIYGVAPAPSATTATTATGEGSNPGGSPSSSPVLSPLHVAASSPPLVPAAHRLSERVFPKLVSARSPLFDYASCHFVVRRAKESTARVVVAREFGVANSFTVEASFGGVVCEQPLLGTAQAQAPAASPSHSPSASPFPASAPSPSPSSSPFPFGDGPSPSSNPGPVANPLLSSRFLGYHMNTRMYEEFGGQLLGALADYTSPSMYARARAELEAIHPAPALSAKQAAAAAAASAAAAGEGGVEDSDDDDETGAGEEQLAVRSKLRPRRSKRGKHKKGKERSAPGATGGASAGSMAESKESLNPAAAAGTAVTSAGGAPKEKKKRRARSKSGERGATASASTSSASRSHTSSAAGLGLGPALPPSASHVKRLLERLALEAAAAAAAEPSATATGAAADSGSEESDGGSGVETAADSLGGLSLSGGGGGGGGHLTFESLLYRRTPSLGSSGGGGGGAGGVLLHKSASRVRMTTEMHMHRHGMGGGAAAAGAGAGVGTSLSSSASPSVGAVLFSRDLHLSADDAALQQLLTQPVMRPLRPAFKVLSASEDAPPSAKPRRASGKKVGGKKKKTAKAAAAK